MITKKELAGISAVIMNLKLLKIDDWTNVSTYSWGIDHHELIVKKFNGYDAPHPEQIIRDFDHVPKEIQDELLSILPLFLLKIISRLSTEKSTQGWVFPNTLELCPDCKESLQSF